MHSLLRTVCVAAAVVIVCSHACAAEKTMPIDFVGDWCRESVADNETTYALPSWTEDGHCTDILSIDKYGFYFHDKDKTCEPVKMRLRQDTAHSGITYMATVTARCPTYNGKLQTFEFSRYKGHLWVTAK